MAINNLNKQEVIDNTDIEQDIDQYGVNSGKNNQGSEDIPDGKSNATNKLVSSNNDKNAMGSDLDTPNVSESEEEQELLSSALAIEELNLNSHLIPDTILVGFDSDTFITEIKVKFIESSTEENRTQQISSQNIQVNLNEPPIAFDDSGITDESTPLIIQPLLNDTDVDSPTLQIVAVEMLPASSGVATLLDDNRIEFDPNQQYGELNSGTPPATISFSYTVSDGQLTDQGTITVSITGIDPKANPDFVTISEDDVIILQDTFLFANDVGQSDQWMITNVGNPVPGSAVLPSARGTADGINNNTAIVYDTNGEFDALQVGESARVIIPYSLEDVGALTDSTTLTVTIEGINDAPIAVDDLTSTDEDTSLIIQPLLNDFDVDSPNLKIIAVEMIPASQGTVTLLDDTRIEFDPNGQYVDLPDNSSKKINFTYTISDGELTNQATITVKINGLDPLARSDVVTISEDDAMIIVDVLANDGSQGDQLVLTQVDSPDPSLGSAALVNNNTAIQFNTNGEFEFLGTDETQSVTISYTMRDGTIILGGGPLDFATDSSMLTVIVEGINDAPAFIALDNFTINENVADSAFLTVNAVDPENDPVTYAIANTDGDGRLFAIDATTGELTIKDPANFEAPLDDNQDNLYDVVVTATDSNGLMDTQSLQINVTNVNEAPTLLIPVTNPLETDTLDGSNGFNMRVGGSRYSAVSNAGDINNDGIDDIMVTLVERTATGPGIDNNRAYILFGDDSPFTSPIDLRTLDGTDGFIIDNIAGGSENISGIFYNYANSAGDVNGDGIDDLLIADLELADEDPNGGYVIFGVDSTNGGSFPALIDASTDIDGSNGFFIQVDDDFGKRFSFSAVSFDGLGDINGDNINDFILAGSIIGENFNPFSGAAYVIFGQDVNGGGAFDLNNGILDATSLDGTNGFSITGINPLSSGVIGHIGDINNDGLNDIIVGAPLAGVIALGAGQGYVIFGSDSGFNLNGDNQFDATTLDGNNGFYINNGLEPNTTVTISANGIGDINGDGIDDFTIGSEASGEYINYILFGNSNEFSLTDDHVFRLDTINGNNGFTIIDDKILIVDGAGDINNDGIDDLIITEKYQPQTNGEISYVIFGSAQGFDSNIDLDALDGTTGFIIDNNANFGNDILLISRAGDVNNDGIDDLIMGEYQRDSYVIFGSDSSQFNVAEGDSFSIDLAATDPDNNDSLTFGIVPGVGDDTFFSIDQTSGVLSLNNPADFETPLDANGDNGYEVTVTVTDAGGLSDAKTLTVNITNVNEMLTAVDDSVTTDEDSAVVIDALNNDIDIDNDELTIIGISPLDPSDGLVTIINNGSQIAFDPNGQYDSLKPGQSEMITLNYTASDGEFSDQAEITITIDGVNDKPVANPDSVTLSEDFNGFVTINVLDNDTDADGDSLGVFIDPTILSPGLGAAGFLLDNSAIVYSPLGNFNQLENNQFLEFIIQYEVSDGLETSVGEVTVTIEGVNDAPIAGAAIITTDEDTPIDFNPVNVASDPEGQTLTVDNVSITGGEGSISRNGNTITYTPALSYQDLDTGQDELVTISYTLSDTQGGETTGSYQIEVTGITDNEMPMAGNDSATTNEDSTVIINALNNDSDPNNDNLTIISVGPLAPSDGLVTIINNGSQIAFNPNGKYDSLKPGQSEMVTINYTVSDGELTDQAQITVTINGVNDKPVANADTATTNEDSAIIIEQALDNDTDIEGDELSIISVDPIDPSIGIASIVSVPLVIDGVAFLGEYVNQVQFDPNGQYNDLANGEQATVMLNYTISDGSLTDNGMITVTITGVNDAPIAGTIFQITDENTTKNFTPVNLASDPEGQPLTVSNVFIAAGGGSVSLNGNTIIYDPIIFYDDLDDGEKEFVTINYRLTDTQGGQTNGSYQIEVNGITDTGSVDPIILDLDGDGFNFSNRYGTNPLLFDIDSDGVLENTAWVADSQDGFLFYDKNQDGRVTQGEEISFTQYVDGAQTDLEGLRAFDSNDNALLDSHDSQYDLFKVWNDSNSNGISETDEIMQLEELGIEAIGLTSDNQFEIDGDVTIYGYGKIYYSDGSQGQLADTGLKYSEINADSSESNYAIYNTEMVSALIYENKEQPLNQEQISNTELNPDQDIIFENIISSQDEILLPAETESIYSEESVVTNVHNDLSVITVSDNISYVGNTDLSNDNIELEVNNNVVA